MKSAHKLLIVIPSLGGGGAERATVDLVRGLDRQRFDVSIALFSTTGRFREQLPLDVQVHNLQGRSQYDLRLVWRLAHLLRHDQPALILSVLRYANLVTLLAHRWVGGQTRVIINEQNLPSAEFAVFGGAMAKGWALRHLYPRADLVTAISQGIARELTSVYGLDKDQVQVIPNPVDLARVQGLAAVPSPHPWFQSGLPVVLGVGRLHLQKGFDHLIRAFAAVRSCLPCKLIIIGEGPKRPDLEQLVSQLGLSEDVALPGFQDNPYGYMRHATAFVLSSLYEGFGNVLVDALALGTPVISTRCPVGPDEIISDGITGLLVPPADDAALAHAILRVLQDDKLRHNLSLSGPPRAANYRLEHIVSLYETVFTQFTNADTAC